VPSVTGRGRAVRAAGGSAAGVDLGAVFAQQPTAYLVVDRDLVIVEANQAYLELLGRTREELVGRWTFDAFPPSEDALDDEGRNPLQVSFERARDTGRPDPMPLFHYDVLDQATGQLQHRVWSLISAPVLDAAGVTQLVLQRVEDVTDYVTERERLAEIAREEGSAQLQVVEAELFVRAQELRAALAAEETATRRLAGLAGMSLQLAAATTLTELTETVVGAGLAALGADGGGVGVRRADGVVELTITGRLGAEVQQRYAVLPPDSRVPVAWSAATGERLVLPDRAAGLAWDPEMAEVHAATGRHAWLAVPLRVGDRLLGALVGGWVEEHRFTDDELDLAEAFAAQCAQALDRLLDLAEERRAAQASRELSETLQQSLLTETPPLEHLQIAVRYRPATAGAQVGGDWYDAFEVDDGSLTLVVGDVTGHDRNAAAVMGQLRNVLRGVAQTVLAPPAQVLGALDTALDRLRVRTLATALLAQVRQDAADIAAGTCSVRWSNAGHPPPVLLLADGTVTVLERRPEMLLGVHPAVSRTDHDLLLPEGATLLLYTDGLVERRGEDLDTGTQRLCATAAELAGLPIEELCDALLDRLGDALDDDVALLAVRVRQV
jgi:PAS domain S-box-containing protein